MSTDGITHLLPVRNGEKFLLSCLSSVVKNARQNDQIIVIDDGSDDATLQIARLFNYQGIDHIIETTGGVGLVLALNLGFSLSKNNWVARYDVDDVYCTNRIAVQEKLRHPEVGAIFSDYSFHDERGNYLGFIPSPITDLGTVISLLASQQTPHPIALINKELFDRVGGYQEQDFPAEDLSLWIRLSEISTLISASESLFSYRISSSSTSGSRLELVYQKRAELINEWGLGQNRLPEFRNQLKNTKKEYKNSSHSKLRIIFLYRNLLIYHAKIQSPKNQILMIRFQLVLVAFSAPITSVKTLYYLFLRKRTRKS